MTRYNVFDTAGIHEMAFRNLVMLTFEDFLNPLTVSETGTLTFT